MTNLKIYQICHNLITYFVTLKSPKKSQLGLIFRTGGSNSLFVELSSKQFHASNDAYWNNVDMQPEKNIMNTCAVKFGGNADPITQ